MSVIDPRTAARPDVTQAICVDIGGSYMKYGQSFGAGRVVARGQIRTPTRSWPDFTAALASLAERDDPGGRLPVAISIAATIDRDNGRALAVNIPCLAGHDLPRELSEALGRAVIVANDADSFALAEATVGTGRGHDVVFALILGTGVGGGLVIRGEPVHGPGGVVAEWGHGAIIRTAITLADGETVTLPRFACGCGQKGCLDTIGGARGLERLHHHLTGDRRNSHQLLDRWETGDPTAIRTISVWAELLAEPLAFLVNVLGCTVMPVGGGLAEREALIATLDLAVRDRTLYPAPTPLIRPGQHRRDGGLVGVSVLAARGAT